VKNGQWRAEVEEVRRANEVSKDEADRLKVARLPVIKPSGIFRGLGEADLVTHSGILCIDLDDVGDRIESVRNSLQTHPAVLAIHLSPRATGLKVFLAIQARDPAEHKACWQAASADLRRFLPEGINIDSAPSNVSANCFVSYDPEAWIAETPRSPVVPLPSSASHGLGRRKEEAISEKSEESMSDLPAKTVTLSHQVGSPEYSRKVRSDAEREIKALPRALAQIFKNYLSKKPVERGQSYAFLLQTIPPLFEVVGVDVLLKLLHLHHRNQTGTWSTSLKKHIDKAKTMLSDWAKTDYLTRLNEDERKFYGDLLRERYREAFRILRDLARRAKDNARFFMSANELGARLGCHQDTAHETLKELKAERIIEAVTNGKPWQKGECPKATIYRWLLSLPQYDRLETK